MIDRFEVPEPSEEAVKAHDNAMYSSRLAEPLRAAYLVDVPRLCRAEVERALNALRFCDDGTGAAYLSARFPEAAPEPTLASLYGYVPNLTGGKGSVEYVRETRDKCQCEGLVHIEGCPYRVPTPSAPAEATEDAFDAELRALLNRHSAENGSDTPDFLLADFLRLCLGAFEGIVRDRDKWHGFKPFGASMGEDADDR